MVAAGLTAFALKGGAIARSFKSMKQAQLQGFSGIEFSLSLWLGWMAVSAVAVAVVMQVMFQIPVWMTFLAIFLAYLLSVMAVRAYGETDINPVGTMGYATQMIYGAIAPGNMMTCVVTAGVTASGANQAADLMEDFKTGHLLGATPKRQTYAQLVGVAAGAIAAVPIFFALTEAFGLGSEALQAPSAMAWSGMAQLLSKGFDALPQYTLTGVTIGVIAGILLSFLENTNLRKFVPSPFGLGIAMMITPDVSIMIFLGAMTKLVLDKRLSRWMEDYSIPLASGLLVGESIIGVLIALFSVMGVL
jgi:OPT family oligopeptide transporter